MRDHPSTMTDSELGAERRRYRHALRGIADQIYALEVQTKLIENTLDVIDAEIQSRKNDGDVDFEYNSAVNTWAERPMNVN